ncbi:MAG: drug resistance transporter, EmrB/QacA subfamily [Acidimicrobiaceae bacterium]|nr:drug resistance transporter, EmrB/QacA subfamily [Acidimicrobiaceae bacterium]
MSRVTRSGAPQGGAGEEAGALAPEQGGLAQTIYSHREILVIMSGLMLGMLLAALDQTIVSTALPTITRDLHRVDLYSWVVTSYLLTSTASTPLYGKLGDLYGRKRLFQFAIVIFLVGSVLSGLSSTMYELIIFRGVQGIGSGGLMTLAMAIVGDVIPPRQRGRYQGYFGVIFGASSVLGPLVGGFLVDAASWRWVFYVNIPIGLFALVVVNRVLRADRAHRKAKIDWTGATLIVLGVSLLLVGVQDFGEKGTLTTAAWSYGLGGLVFIAAFLWWEGRVAEPIVPLGLFRNSVFRTCVALAFIAGIVMFGAIVFLPRYIQEVKGVSPTFSGLRLLPLMVGLLGTSISSGLLVSKRGRYRNFVIAGTALLTIGIGLLYFVRINTSSWALSGILIVVGAGIGLFMQITVLAVQNALDISELGVGTSAVTFFRTLGGAIGTSVLGAVLLAQQRADTPADVVRYGPRLGPLHAFVSGMDRAYLYCVPVAFIAFVISFFLREVPLRDRQGAAVPME